MNPQLKSDR